MTFHFLCIFKIRMFHYRYGKVNCKRPLHGDDKTADQSVKAKRTCTVTSASYSASDGRPLNLLDLPIELLEEIIKCLNYEEASRLRIVGLLQNITLYVILWTAAFTSFDSDPFMLCLILSNIFKSIVVPRMFNKMFYKKLLSNLDPQNV